jgi:lambda family phage minor tail protein L
MSIDDQVFGLELDATIELFVLDCTGIGGSVLRFCNEVNQLQQPVVWQGLTYTPYPIKTEGWELTGNGPLPRPKVTLSNMGGMIWALSKTMTVEDFKGALFTRKRTQMRFLDAVNFTAGNALADPNSYFPDDTYIVDRRSADAYPDIQYELRSPLDLPDRKLPARMITQNVCAWKEYRDSDCGYTGTNYFDINNQPVATPALDRCNKSYSACKLRFPAPQSVRFGAYPAVSIVRA